MKHMKKSMFITTLIMTVVLVVALSTATFAWYTANTAVGATATQVLTASSQTASLVIAPERETSSVATSDTVSIDMTTNIAPMVYATASAAAPTVGTTTYGSFITSFYTMIKDANGKLTAAASTTPPSQIATDGVTANGYSPSTAIFLSNVGSTNFASSTATFSLENYNYVAADVSGLTSGESSIDTLNFYVLSGKNYVAATGTYDSSKSYFRRIDGNGNMIIAVFAGAYTDADADLTYKGMVSSLASVQIGNSTTIAAGGVGDDIAEIIGNGSITSPALTAPNSSVSLGAIASQSAIKVKLVVWFEGGLMTNANSGTGATFSISFAASAN